MLPSGSIAVPVSRESRTARCGRDPGDSPPAWRRNGHGPDRTGWVHVSTHWLTPDEKPIPFASQRRSDYCQRVSTAHSIH